MAVAPQVVAAEAAVQVLERGGNAIDAAVAGGFVQCVVDPVMCGLGGFGSLIYREAATGKVSVMDFVARAGSRVTEGQWATMALGRTTDQFGYRVTGNINEVGYSSIAVPGTIDGFGESHRRWGRLPWADLLVDAIRLAREGFTVTESTADFWLRPAAEGRTDGPDRLRVTPASERIYAAGGRPLRAGDSLVQSDQGAVLEALAAFGHRYFYEGALAERIADDFEGHGGTITLGDLQDYHSQEVEPVVSTYRGYEVYGTPPPSGGLMVLQMLHILERFSISGLGHNSTQSIRLLVEAMKFARRMRDQFGADPEFTPIPIDTLIKPSFVDGAVQDIDSGLITDDGAPVPESSDTTQLSVVDRDGNAVSLTHSLGYGSGVVSDGLGFQYNNYMNCFNPEPGHVDSIAPGKRRDSSMAPTILVRDGVTHVVIGAPGATRISPSVVQAIANYVDYLMTPVEAVSAPRVDCQGGPVHLEGRIPERTARELTRLGYEIVRHLSNYDRYFARPQMIALRDGMWVGAADPRGDGGISLGESPEFASDAG